MTLSLLTAAVPARERAGTIIGTVTTQEAERPPLRATIDPAVCGSTLPDESLVRDAAGHLSNVVVVVPGAKSPAPAEVQISNDRCRFVPHVALLRPGGTVKMTSVDPVLHTMHAAGADGRALFNVSLPIPKMTLSRPLARPGVVTMSCSTHTWMRGYVYVTDEMAAISGTDGRFRLDGVPAGTHELRDRGTALAADQHERRNRQEREGAARDAVNIPTRLATVTIQPATTAAASPRDAQSFQIEAPDGTPLVTATVLAGDLRASRERWGRATRSLSLMTFAFALVLLTGPAMLAGAWVRAQAARISDNASREEP